MNPSDTDHRDDDLERLVRDTFADHEHLAADDAGLRVAVRRRTHRHTPVTGIGHGAPSYLAGSTCFALQARRSTARSTCTSTWRSRRARCSP